MQEAVQMVVKNQLDEDPETADAEWESFWRKMKIYQYGMFLTK